MINALSTATSGMLAASHALDREATKIVKSGTNAVEQVTDPSPAAPADDLIQSVVNLTTIEVQYAANAKVAETVDRLIGETLNILS